MDPARVELELERVYDRLESEIEVYALLADEASALETGYKLAYARAVREAEGSNQEQRAAAALIACEKEYEVAEQAKTALDVQKQLLSALRTQADLIRTEAANVRTVT